MIGVDVLRRGYSLLHLHFKNKNRKQIYKDFVGEIKQESRWFWNFGVKLSIHRCNQATLRNESTDSPKRYLGSQPQPFFRNPRPA